MAKQPTLGEEYEPLLCLTWIAIASNRELLFLSVLSTIDLNVVTKRIQLKCQSYHGTLLLKTDWQWFLQGLTNAYRVCSLVISVISPLPVPFLLFFKSLFQSYFLCLSYCMNTPRPSISNTSHLLFLLYGAHYPQIFIWWLYSIALKLPPLSKQCNANSLKI